MEAMAEHQDAMLLTKLQIAMTKLEKEGMRAQLYRGGGGGGTRYIIHLI